MKIFSRQCLHYFKLLGNLIFISIGFKINMVNDFNYYLLIPVSIIGLLNLIAIIYFKYKNNQYAKLFIQYTYKPSNIIVIISFVIEVSATVTFYCMIKSIRLGIAHIVMLGLFALLFYLDRPKTHRFVHKNNSRIIFEYGALVSDIPNSPLTKGSFVKILKVIDNKYIVTDYENNQYELECNLLENITKINYT